MSHEMTNKDNAVFHKKPAWHGLGITTDEEFTPHEGLRIGELNWLVAQRQALTRDPAGNDVPIPGYVANYRTDTDPQTYLGLVSQNYVPIQNTEVADFCEALVEEDVEVHCESVGSLREGQLIWFLLKGNVFNVANNDEIFPYILVSNGHSGYESFRVTPTTVRVQCSNTFHMVVPSGKMDLGQLGESAISIRHTVNVMERVQEAKRALKHYSEVLEANKKLMDGMSKKEVTREQIEKFFFESYTVDFGDIPTNPQKKTEENAKARAYSALQSFSKRFDDERTVAGASWWNAFNAYSGTVQHSMKARGKNDEDRINKRIESNLFGLNEERTQNAFRRALKMSLA